MKLESSYNQIKANQPKQPQTLIMGVFSKKNVQTIKTRYLTELTRWVGMWHRFKSGEKGLSLPWLEIMYLWFLEVCILFGRDVWHFDGPRTLLKAVDVLSRKKKKILLKEHVGIWVLALSS